MPHWIIIPIMILALWVTEIYVELVRFDSKKLWEPHE
jgi:hypothetical protein